MLSINDLSRPLKTFAQKYRLHICNKEMFYLRLFISFKTSDLSIPFILL